MLCISTVLCGTGVVWRGWVYSRSGLGSHGKVREARAGAGVTWSLSGVSQPVPAR